MKTRIPFATALRDLVSRTRSENAIQRGTMNAMSDAETEIRAAAKKRARAEEAFKSADGELRELFVQWRAQGVGPSDMARWSGMTREWVARIAPAPKP